MKVIIITLQWVQGGGILNVHLRVKSLVKHVDIALYNIQRGDQMTYKE